MKLLDKMIRPALVIALATGTLLTAHAAGSRRVDASPDSTARALAAVMLRYLAPASTPARVAAADLPAYTEGLAKGLEADPSDPTLTGLMEGAALRERLASLSGMGVSVDRKEFLAALKSAFAGNELGFTPQEGEAYISRMLGVGTTPQKLDPQTEQAFLDSAAAAAGAVVTPLGCVLQTIDEGNGDTPGPEDVVMVAYTGSLSDGTEFDSTGTESIELPVNGVVPGMSEGLRLMRPGGHYRLYIPASHAYGEEGIKGVIPGNATLVFDMRVTGIRAK